MSLKNLAMPQSFASSGLLSFMDTTSVALFVHTSGERFHCPRRDIKSRKSALRDPVVCSYSICSFLMSVVRSFTRACIHFFQPCTPFERVRETDHSANEAAAGPSRRVLPTFKRRCSLRRKIEESERPQRARQLDPGVGELHGQTHRRGSRPIRSCGKRDTRRSSERAELRCVHSRPAYTDSNRFSVGN